MRDITQLDEERSNDETRFIFDAFSALILLLTALAGNTQLYASHQQHAANTLPAGVLLPASSKVPTKSFTRVACRCLLPSYTRTDWQWASQQSKEHGLPHGQHAQRWR